MIRSKSLKLNEIASIETGKIDSNAAKENGEYAFFTCSPETLKTDTYSFDTKAVLLAGNNADGVFPIKYYEGRFDVYQRTYVIRSLDESRLSTRYLFYALSLELEYFRKVSTGATTKFLTLSILKDLRIVVPPIDVQNKIVNILAAFDDLIEINMRQIEILEEIAQSLYNEWFVHFRYPGHENEEIIQASHGPTPKGWNIVPLSTIIDNIKEKEKAGVHLHDLAYIPIDCIRKKSLFLEKVLPGKEAKSSLIRFSKHDVLFGAMRSYFHKVAIAPLDGITRTTCFVLRPKSPVYFAYSVMTLFQESTIQYTSSRSKGSTIPYAVWQNGLADMPIKLPEETVLEKFNKMLIPIFEEFVVTHSKVNILKRIRDLLLPKLISSEIDMRKMEIEASGD